MENVKLPWRWNDWQVVRRIGRGAYGNVYEIKRVGFGLEEHCAMKVMQIPQNAADIDIMRIQGKNDNEIVQTCNGYVADVVKEYKLMLGLSNVPNIVKVYDYEVVKDDNELLWTLFIRMELLTAITRNPECVKTEEQILKLGKDVCSALVACHKRNILHRDVKVQNILVDKDGNFRLGDFGVSRVVENTTQATAGVGSIDYMAPEIALQLGSYGQQADVYSLGMVLYFLLNKGRFPFQPLPPENVTSSVAEDCRRRKWRGETLYKPANGCLEFQKVVLKACEADTKNRYFSAQHMLDALNQIVIPDDEGNNNSEVIPDPTIIDPIEPLVIDPNENTMVDIDNGKNDEVVDKPNDDPGIGDDTIVDGIPPVVQPNGEYHFALTPPKDKPEPPTKPPIEPGTEPPVDPLENDDIDNGGNNEDDPNGNGNGDNEDTGTGKRTLGRYILNAGLVCLAVFLAFSIFNVVSKWIGNSKEPKVDPGYESEETTRDLDAPLKTLEGEWEDGSYQLNIYDEFYAEIKLNEELFVNHDDGVEGISLRLYHDAESDTYYNVGFIYQAGRLHGSATYYANGMRMSGFDPEDFSFVEENGMISAKFQGNSDLLNTLLDIKDVQIVYLLPNAGDSGPQVIYSTFEPEIKESEGSQSSAADDSTATATQSAFVPFPYESQGVTYVEDYDVYTDLDMEVIDAKRLLFDQWNGGGIRVRILDDNRITVDLESDFFTDPESQSKKKSFIVQLYHDLNKNNCYNISFGYNGEELFASAVYLENGTMEYNYTPDIFEWDEENGIVQFNLQANEDLHRSMFELEGIHVIYHTPDESPQVALAYNVPDTCAQVQFIHMEGPDDEYNGEETEKAVIRGMNLAGETIWTHETDVKFEIFQSYQVDTLGYINDKYFYTDEGTLVILDAETGKVLKRVENVGGSVTDVLVDFDGSMYLCCYWGPHFVELSLDYEIVHKIDSFGGMCDWAIDVYKENDMLYVACDLGPMQRQEDYIFEISPDDYSFVLTNPATPINGVEMTSQSSDSARKQSAIKFLEEYRDEYKDYFGVSLPSKPAIMEDITGDGIEEIILHEIATVNDSSGATEDVVQCNVYHYVNGNWVHYMEPKTVGSLSYCGFSGYADVDWKNDKPHLYIYNWIAVEGLGTDPGVTEEMRVTVYDYGYTELESFACIAVWNDNHEQDCTFYINDKEVPYIRFYNRLLEYEGLTFNYDEVCFVRDVESLSVEELLASL